MTPREVAEAVADILIEECGAPIAERDLCVQQFLEKELYIFPGKGNFPGQVARDSQGTPRLDYVPNMINGTEEQNKMVLRTNKRLQAFAPILTRLYDSAAVILNVGCGWLRFKKTLRAGKEITLDKNPSVNPDIVHDLEQYPWPVLDESVDVVVAVDVVEHLDNVLEMVEECWRVLRSNGTLFIRTGTFNEQGFTDPTHKHWFTLNSFDYFDPSTEKGLVYGFYSNYKFKITTKGESGYELVFHLQKQPYLESEKPATVDASSHVLLPCEEA